MKQYIEIIMIAIDAIIVVPLNLYDPFLSEFSSMLNIMISLILKFKIDDDIAFNILDF